MPMTHQCFTGLCVCCQLSAQTPATTMGRYRWPSTKCKFDWRPTAQPNSQCCTRAFSQVGYRRDSPHAFTSCLAHLDSRHCLLLAGTQRKVLQASSFQDSPMLFEIALGYSVTGKRISKRYPILMLILPPPGLLTVRLLVCTQCPAHSWNGQKGDDSANALCRDISQHP